MSTPDTPIRPTKAIALLPGAAALVVAEVERRALRPDDIAMEVLFCGVCGSDLSAVRRGPLGDAPLVPGHELTARVTAVGTDVSDLGVGDLVAVGNIVDSCRTCPECRDGQENFCRELPTPTYGGHDRHDGRPQFGGWSGELVADRHFVYRLPAGLDPAAAAPLMCAGVTVWEPLRHWGIGPGSRVGVVGLGGLGHLAVRFAVALGAHVTVLTTSPGKAEAALALGAQEVVVSADEAAMRARQRTLDLIVDCGAGSHDPSPYLDLLVIGGTMCLLGAVERVELASFSLRWGRHSLAGSGTGSPNSTAEMLAFAAEHDIAADIELLPASRHSEALERLAKGDVRWRFVLDMRELGAIEG